MKDIVIFNEHPKSAGDTFVGMNINNKFYGEKAEAGKALINACNRLKDKAETIGDYRGFQMEIMFDSFRAEFNMCLKGNVRHNLVLGEDPFGNISRLDNVLVKIEDKLEKSRQALDAAESNLINAKKDLDRVFPQEKELAEKIERLNELNIILNTADDVKEEDIDYENPKQPIKKRKGR